MQIIKGDVMLYIIDKLTFPSCYTTDLKMKSCIPQYQTEPLLVLSNNIQINFKKSTIAFVFKIVYSKSCKFFTKATF